MVKYSTGTYLKWIPVDESGQVSDSTCSNQIIMILQMRWYLKITRTNISPNMPIQSAVYLPIKFQWFDHDQDSAEV